MDDRDLEARLRRHLHRRLGGAAPPPDLRASVQQLLATRPQPLGVRGFRASPTMRIGLSVAIGVAAVVLLVLAADLGLNGGLVGRGPSASPSPGTPSLGPAERSFLVLPPTAARPSKAESSLAVEVLKARLRALGIGTFVSGVGDAIQFRIPAEGPSADVIRAVLAATGDVEFVPLPGADYGTTLSPGPLTAEIGKPLPRAEPPLFGWDGIASVAPTTTQAGQPAVDLKLRAAAATAFDVYTTAHVGEFFAVVIDGKVAVAPAVMEPITSGEVEIDLATNAGGDTPDAAAAAAAILIGGELPAAWRGATVPVVISRDDATSKALAATAGGVIGDTSLNGELIGGVWHAIWNVAVDNPGCSDLGSCPNADSALVKIDAVSGVVIEVTAPAP